MEGIDPRGLNPSEVVQMMMDNMKEVDKIVLEALKLLMQALELHLYGVTDIPKVELYSNIAAFLDETLTPDQIDEWMRQRKRFIRDWKKIFPRREDGFHS